MEAGMAEDVILQPQYEMETLAAQAAAEVNITAQALAAQLFTVKDLQAVQVLKQVTEQVAVVEQAALVLVLDIHQAQTLVMVATDYNLALTELQLIMQQVVVVENTLVVLLVMLE
jgi:hypothetical protein